MEEKGLQVFSFQDKQVRVVMENGEPWWVAADVCGVLEFGNPRQALETHLEADEKGVQKMDTLGGEQSMTVISESGLYTLIMRSNKPEAKKFRRWVTSEVLPAIRKHGAYATPAKIDELLADPDAWIKTLTALKNEREEKLALAAQIEAERPKVLFADSVAASSTSILVGELAKILRQNGVEVGQNRLFEYLRSEGYLMSKGSSHNMPTQKSMELGLFEIKETAINRSDGNIDIKKTPKVTGKGQLYFVSTFQRFNSRAPGGEPGAREKPNDKEIIA